MPFPGAACDLAESFGFQFSNGFAEFANHVRGRPGIYEEHSGLIESVVTLGRNERERISKVATFTGSAFQIPDGAVPVLVFQTDSISREPEVAWEFDDGTPDVNVAGWSQGAIMKIGKGKIAVFGEAGMFTAQLAGEQKRKMGMTAPHAEQNHRLLLNVMHWLSDLEGMSD